MSDGSCQVKRKLCLLWPNCKGDSEASELKVSMAGGSNGSGQRLQSQARGTSWSPWFFTPFPHGDLFNPAKVV